MCAGGKGKDVTEMLLGAAADMQGRKTKKGDGRKTGLREKEEVFRLE